MKPIVVVVLFITSFSLVMGQCDADAGDDKHRCSPDSTIELGGSPAALNGTPPYTYE